MLPPLDPEDSQIERLILSKLFDNPLRAASQLLLWILLLPSAWRTYISQHAPHLKPDFTLTQLSMSELQSAPFRRMLGLIYLVWPLCIGGIIALILLITGTQPTIVLLASLFGMSLGLASGLVTGAAVSVAGGLAAIVAVGISMGLGVGWFGLMLELPAQTVVIGRGNENSIAITGGFGFIALGLIGAVIASIREPEQSYPFVRRTGAILVGILISGVVVGVAIGMQDLALSLGNLEFYGQIYGLLGGIVLGLIFALTVALRTWRIPAALISGVILALVVIFLRSVMYGPIAPVLTQPVAGSVGLKLLYGGSGIIMGPLLGILFGTVIVLPFVLVERVAGGWAGALAGALGGGGMSVVFSYRPGNTLWIILSLGLLCIVIGLSYSLWLPALLYPFEQVWNSLLYRLDKRRTAESQPFLHFHSAFWDEHQRLPLSDLDRYLVLAIERTPAIGESALATISASHQKWAARSAQIELDARLLESSQSVNEIVAATYKIAAGELSGPASSLLRSFSRIGDDLSAAIAQESIYNQRLSLSALEDRLDGLLRELTRSNETYSSRFRPIATHWRQVIARHAQALAADVELRQEIDSPYIIGVPLTAQQEIFVGRTEVSSRIEQLLLDRRHPPLLLYGQRRMGKTSLLNNLGRLLPSTIIPMFVDLQGPTSLASDYSGFLYNLARGMITSARRQRELDLPAIARSSLESDPFTAFDEWLDLVEESLGERTALLALDEFEALEEAIASGRYEAEAVLGTLRHIIQHRPQFKILLTGSHVVEELQNWASYLVNVQVVRIGYLKENEVRQLIERPTPDFALQYETDASQRVIDLTRGHPALTQLLCYEIVALKNDGLPSTRRLATLTDVDEAIPSALESGSFFFTEMANQVGQSGKALLQFLSHQGEEAIVEELVLRRYYKTLDLAENTSREGAFDTLLTRLLRRDLIEAVQTGSSGNEEQIGYRFQVELFRRWFVDG
ncbi:MAG: AAA family ATPase [Chloroflexota bacterium]